MKIKSFGPGVTPGINTYVGIDQSYSGFAITFLGKDNSYKTTVARFDSRGVDRLVEIKDHVQETMLDMSEVNPIKDVAIEGYAFGSQMANMLGELGGIVKVELRNLEFLNDGKYPMIVPPTVLKKYVTGRGTGVQKAQILLQVYKKWGVEFPDDNAADSYGLAHLVAGKGKAEYEQDIYKKMSNADYRER